MKIPGFTEHGDRYRQHVTLDADTAREVAAEAQARGLRVSDILRERVRRRGGSTPQGAPVREWTTSDGRRVAIYEWRPEAAEETKE